jgi:NAD(P)-dependent dehydrogenase (short-subunit alcohol dehydrogenase family)
MSRAHYPSLEHKHIFITGGATGIGADMVKQFAQQSRQVTFFDRDNLAGTALAKTADNIRFIAGDVCDITALQTAITQAEGNPVDVLISNAANDERHTFKDLSPEYWDHALAVNLRPHVFAAQAAASVMKNSGSIILMGSVSWMRRRTGMVAYTTSKAGIHGLTRTLAQELGPEGIRVNSIVPGAIQTEKQDRLVTNPELIQSFLDQQALKFRLQAQDVTAMALFLAADDSRACTGQAFIVDAGIV